MMFDEQFLDSLPEDSMLAARVVGEQFWPYVANKENAGDTNGQNAEYVLQCLYKLLYDSLYDNTAEVQRAVTLLTRVVAQSENFDVYRKKEILKQFARIHSDLDSDVMSSTIIMRRKKDTRPEIVCKNCRKTGRVDISKYPDLSIPIKVRCSCGAAFKVILDRRKYQRKEVKLPGVYTRINTDIGGEAITLEDISRGGVGFRTRYRYDIRTDERLYLRFILDNDVLREIRKEVVVRHVAGHFIGAQFYRIDACDQLIGAYLMGDMGQ